MRCDLCRYAHFVCLNLSLCWFATAANSTEPMTTFIPSVWEASTPIASAPRQTDAAHDLTTVIANGKVSLHFKSAEKGFGLGSMTLVENGREVLSQVDDKTVWWAIDVRMPDGKMVTVDNVGAPMGKFMPFRDASTGGDFIWEKVPVAGDGGSLDVT